MTISFSFASGRGNSRRHVVQSLYGCINLHMVQWHIWYHWVPHSTSILNIIPNLLVISLEMRIAIAPKCELQNVPICSTVFSHPSCEPSTTDSGTIIAKRSRKEKKGPLPNHYNHHCHIHNKFNYLHHVS